MAKIILSYRRADSDLVAGRMHDRLAKQYGNDSVFIDVDNIPVDQDYRQHIKDALTESDVLIVIVGPKWLGGSKRGQARIHDADDPVRVEVETALTNGIPIIPVLIGCENADRSPTTRQSQEFFLHQRRSSRYRPRFPSAYGAANPDD